MEGLGWQVDPSGVPNVEVATGIDRAREAFPRIYFNKDRTDRLVECLKRYRWNVNSKTGQATQPLHDEFSHGADAFRYLALVADVLNNNIGTKPIKYTRKYLA
jgi:phage terminase large subunit